MKLHLRMYCYGCRIGSRWGQGVCLYRRGQHRWLWDYYIECDGRRLVQRSGFANATRARRSAQRAYEKLAETSCIEVAS